MNRICRKHVAMSRSGSAALYRKIKQYVDFLKETTPAKDAWTYVKWQSGNSLNEFKERGCYIIDGERTELDDGFPNLYADVFCAMLMVTDTTLEGDAWHEGIVGQLLFVSDSQSGTSILYTRSYIYNSENSEWTPWEVYGGNNDSLARRLLLIEQKIFPLIVTLNVTPTIQEYTGNTYEFKLSWSIKINDVAVIPTEISLKVGNNSIPVDKEDLYKTISASDDVKATLTVEAEGRSATKSIDINFARNYYTAVVDADWSPTSDTICALAKKALKTSAAASVTYSAAVQKKIVFAYPVSHGLMTSIKDVYGNSMFAIGNSGKTFNTSPQTVTVTMPSGATLRYYVYESNVTNITDGVIIYTTNTFD